MSQRATKQPATMATTDRIGPEMGYRMIKWVGDRAVLKSDGFSVANWKHENRRAYPIPFPPGSHGNIIKIVEKGWEGVSRDYSWDRYSQDWTIPVQTEDAVIIMRLLSHEFRDVTGVADTTKVRNAPLILPAR